MTVTYEKIWNGNIAAGKEWNNRIYPDHEVGWEWVAEIDGEPHDERYERLKDLKRDFPNAVKAAPREFTHYVVVEKTGKTVYITGNGETPEEAIKGMANYKVSSDFNGDDGLYVLPAIHHYKRGYSKINLVGETAWVDWYYPK